MTVSNAPVIKSPSNLHWQLPSFIAIGLFGFIVDSTVTFALVRSLGVDPLLARIPAFILATVLNFGLNRLLTFRNSSVSLWQAFFKYVLVCALGFCVNFIAYALAYQIVKSMGYVIPTAFLPLFVAWGSGCAMFVTFIGYRQFAFRD